jgi:hypothetical protein
MLKDILIYCIIEMIVDPMFLFTFDYDTDFKITSYRLKNMGKGRVYCCETDSPEKVFYVSEERVMKRIEELRNERIDGVLNHLLNEKQ